jgi:myosin-1
MATRIQRFWRKNKYGIRYVQLKDYSQQLLAGRKERRRFSLISQRVFCGDYLDLRDGSGVGSSALNAINLKPGEEVDFSMRGTMLVPRAMRSSVPSPRIFVLVKHYFFIEKKKYKLITISYTIIDKSKLPYCYYYQKWKYYSNG